MLIARQTYTYAYLLKDTYLFRFLKGHIYRTYTYTCLTDLILVLQSIYLYIGSYNCITELILVFRILYLYYVTYSCVSDLILVFRILCLYYGAYSCISELILILLVRKYSWVLQKFYLYKSTRRYYRTYTGTSYLILVQILFSNHFLSFSFRVSVCDFTYGYKS